MSSMADLMGAMQGGPSPDLGGGTAGDLGGGGGVPLDDQASADASSQYSTSLDALQGAEDALHAFIQLDPDNTDRAKATQALQIVIQLQASNSDAAQSGDLSSLQRALQGGPAANASPIQPPTASTPTPGY